MVGDSSSDVGQYGRLARWYDPLYGALGKDPVDEARGLLGLVDGLGITPTSLLDVACGTGAHLARFAEDVDDCVGVDLSPAMLAVARDRLGDRVPLHEADMRTLDLGRSFDVVTCLFSAIGHVEDGAELDAAVAAMARHVAPGGVLLVEPWLQPDDVYAAARQPGGYRSVETAETEHGVVTRVIRSHVDGDALVLRFGWAVADHDGVVTLQERFRMPLFTRTRYLAAVTAAGLEESWRQPDELVMGRGLLVGRRAAS